MPVVNNTVVRSLGEAAAASVRLIEKCTDHAVAALQAAAAQATQAEQRQQVEAAWRALAVRRTSWGTRFPQLLAAALDAEASGRARTDPLPTPSGFAALALVDDVEISRKIESSRLAQQLAASLERPLAELDALMSSALGLPGVQPERNPLRPVVYANALRTLMSEGQADPAWPALWLRHMAAPLAQELDQLYRDQTHLLTLARVNAANYRLVSAPSRPNPAAPAPPHGSTARGGSDGAAGGPGGPAGASPGLPADAGPSGFAELPSQAIEGHRLQQFLLHGESQGQRPLGPSYYAQAEAELRALQGRQESRGYDRAAAREHMHLPAVERPPRHVGTDSPLPQEVWGEYGASRQRSLVRGRLKTQARELGQVYGLEVVRKLVNQVAEDPRLLTPVREAIVALEPSLLRLAMVAPRFFSDEAHPGRLLVEKVAERSFKYNDEFSVEFQGFFVPVGQGFCRLNQVEKFQDAGPFKTVLVALQAGWAAQDALDEEAQRKVLDAVQFAERRQHEADRIAGDLGRREDLASAAPPVRDFLLGPWALVIAHARLTQPRGGIDPGGHVGVVTDLLWSVKRELTLHEPARAFELIPRVLLKLREGLAMLGQEPSESATFLRQLEVLHRPVLKLRARHRHRDMAPAEPIRLGDETAQAPGAPDRAWMAPGELRAAGFEDTQPSHFAQLSPSHPAPAAEPVDERDCEALLASLGPGAWVDLYSRQHWRRARLVWASDKGTLFMFLSHGGQPHSMTRRSIERLLRDRLLRLVEGDGVVPRAIEKLGQPSGPMPLAA